MSRNVPLDRALDDRDRRYLRDMGAFGAVLEARVDAEFPPNPEELETFNRAERKRLTDLNGTGLTGAEQDVLLDENARLKAEVERLQAALAGNGSNAPSYTGWSKAQLEAEIDRVNDEDEEIKAGTKEKLAKGKVAEMVATLSEYFTE